MANLFTKTLIGLNKLVDPEFRQFMYEQENISSQKGISKAENSSAGLSWSNSPSFEINLAEFGIGNDPTSDSKKEKHVEHRKSILTYDQMWEFYKYNPLIRGCIDTKAKQVSSLDWAVIPKNVHWLKNNSMPKKEKAIKDYLTQLLYNPNNYDESFQALMSKVLVDLLLFDAAALIKIYDKKTQKPIGLKALHGPHLRFITNKKREVVGYIDIKTDEVYTEKEIIYLKFHGSSKELYGCPPIESIIPEITGDMYSIIYNNKYFSENEVPHGILYLGDIDKVNYDRVKASFRAYKAKHYALRMIASKSEPKWINFKQTNKDMQVLEFQDKIRKRIMMVYQINENELGYTSDMKSGGGEEQSKIFNNKGIKPLCKFIEYHINTEFISELDSNFEFQFDRSDEIKKHEELKQSVIQTDLMKIQIFNLAYTDGKISLKEYRDLLRKLITIDESIKLEDLDWTDVNIIQGGGYNSLQNALAMSNYELKNTMSSGFNIKQEMGNTDVNKISISDFKDYLEQALTQNNKNGKKKPNEISNDLKSVLNSLNIPQIKIPSETTTNQSNLPSIPNASKNSNNAPVIKNKQNLNVSKVSNPDPPKVNGKKPLPNPLATKTMPKHLKVKRSSDS